MNAITERDNTCSIFWVIEVHKDLNHHFRGLEKFESPKTLTAKVQALAKQAGLAFCEADEPIAGGFCNGFRQGAVALTMEEAVRLLQKRHDGGIRFY